VEDAAVVIDAISGYDPRDPFALDERADLAAAVRRAIDGWRIAYSPDFDVFPVEPAVARVVEDSVRAFEQVGAHLEQVRLGIEHDQRELTDLWCRLIIPINVAAFEMFKRNGMDLLADHRDDFPPEYLRWVDEGYELRAPQLMRDEELRTEIYDAIQGALADHELLVTPTLRAWRSRTRPMGNTKRPGRIGDVDVDPLIGWCLTYPVNFSGHPAASIPAGMVDGLPVGMQIIGRRYADADADVLAASAALERIRPWRDSYESRRGPPDAPARAVARRRGSREAASGLARQPPSRAAASDLEGAMATVHACLQEPNCRPTRARPTAPPRR
jgi:amidase/aspartyl-tRNA(Asn)/glutamyl-tRNA(Gln) amidotransferase subunit A